MPIYQCSAQAGLLTDKMKAQIATAITDAHVEATGADPRRPASPPPSAEYRSAI